MNVINHSAADRAPVTLLFEGIQPKPGLIPDYLLERMKPVFEAAQAKYVWEVRTGVEPDWCVYIQHQTEWHWRHLEWVEYQCDEGDFHGHKNFERYGYTEGMDAYTVSVLDKKTRNVNLEHALEIFSCLNTDPQLLSGYVEEVGHMATYSIIRLQRDILSQDGRSIAENF